MKIKLPDIATPYYLIDEKKLIENLEALKHVIDKTGCKILLAQKAFSMFSVYPLIGEYLHGTAASGLFEARLSYEEMGKENHIFSPAYLESEFDEILSVCSHVVFNSFSQLARFKDKAVAAKRSIGLRINPEASTQNKPIYDPCSPYSRMGVTKANFREDMLDNVDGFHFHTLCEQDSDALEITLKKFEKDFAKYFKHLKWLNFGGGHHITKKGYGIERLIGLIDGVQQKYGLQVYLEPGEAVVLDAGYLVSSVLDFVDNGIVTAILDASAACHMPDVLEVPYRPQVVGAGDEGEKKYSYRFAGNTCLAGDIIGDYSFDNKLVVDDKIIFCDMALYTMVKNNTFNGLNLPSIVLAEKSGNHRLIKTFNYSDFKNRLS